MLRLLLTPNSGVPQLVIVYTGRAMTISYKLSFEGNALAQWSVEKQTRPPSRIVLIPSEVLELDELKPYFRRANVVSHTKTELGFNVQLEAVRMTAAHLPP